MTKPWIEEDFYSSARLVLEQLQTYIEELIKQAKVYKELSDAHESIAKWELCIKAYISGLFYGESLLGRAITSFDKSNLIKMWKDGCKDKEMDKLLNQAQVLIDKYEEDLKSHSWGKIGENK